MKRELSVKGNTFDTPGDRLREILDKVEFDKFQDRGRVLKFHEYLMENNPAEFGDMKYSTCRAWFSNNAPTMKKIDIVFETLLMNYEFNHNISHIKTWWKAGGYYPFDNFSISQADRVDVLDKKRLEFLVMGILYEQMDKDVENVDTDKLLEIKEQTIQFANDFCNPNVNVCNVATLTRFIRSFIV